MVKLKDLIKIMPNPKEFYLCILDEHDNMSKHPKDMIHSRCTTYDFKTFSFRDIEDAKEHTKDRILELLDYEVTGIDNFEYTGSLSNGESWGFNLETWKHYPENDQEHDRLSHNFFIYIDKPLKKKKAKQEEQTDLFEDLDEVTA